MVPKPYSIGTVGSMTPSWHAAQIYHSTWFECCPPISRLLPTTFGHFGNVNFLSSGMEMAQLICGGCRTLLMYTRGATSVRCSCCNTVNLATAPSNQIAHVNCGHCRTTLMYPYGAPSVKCAVCQYVTNVGMGNVRVPLPASRPNATGTTPSTSTSQTVVVENPMSVDESGKLVSNVVVGITTDKK
ncbi:hypothetical protein HRI_002869200 [Hibiscus trionum]|uniref:Zinc finger LSD1-type domain-containing protein n=1 Tax=Hibiscus trionum TaxID=183268 RepID=A0A9W7M944_HIBTR|nr:hypothetical protein HRI_002869200 [Hibiscus trionum]